MNIDIDFDVFKALTARRTNESVTYNDVLRDLLKLPKSSGEEFSQVHTASGTKKVSQTPSSGDCIWKGVRFPAGTELRAKYKGRTILGRIMASSFQVDGKPYDSPSAAAVAITGTSVNGWRFFECRLPGDSVWKSLDSLRLNR